MRWRRRASARQADPDPQLDSLRELLASAHEPYARGPIYQRLRAHVVAPSAQGEPDTAGTLVVELRTTRPDDRLLAELVAGLAGDFARMARQSLDAGATAEALGHLRRGATILGDDAMGAPDHGKVSARVLCQAATENLEAGEIETAAELALEAIQTQPDNRRALRLASSVVAQAVRTGYESSSVDALLPATDSRPEPATGEINDLVRSAERKVESGSLVRAALILHDAFLLSGAATHVDGRSVGDRLVDAVRPFADLDLPPHKLLQLSAAIETSVRLAPDDLALRRLAVSSGHRIVDTVTSTDRIPAHSSTQRIDEETRHLQRLVDQSPDHDGGLRSQMVEHLLSAAGDKLAEDDLRSAARIIGEALVIAPGEPTCRVLRARIATTAAVEGQSDVAVDMFASALRRDPDDTDAARRLASVHWLRGGVAVSARRAEAAVLDYRAALVLEREHDIAVDFGNVRKLARALRDLADTRLKSGDHDAAFTVTREAYVLQPEQPELLGVALRCAVAAGNQGTYGDELDFAREMQERFPTARAGLRISGLQLRAGRPEDALASVRLVERVDEDFDRVSAGKLRVRIGRALRLRALDALRDGDVEAAEPIVRRAVESAPDDPAVQRLASVFGRLPRASLAGKLSSDRRTLVVVEHRTDLTVLACYLRVLGSHATYGERSVRGFARGVDRFVVDDITSVANVGQIEEARIARDTDPLAKESRALVSDELPDALATAAGLDMMEHTAWEFDDMLFRVGRKLDLFRGLIESGHFERVVFLLGDARLARCLQATAAGALGADNVQLLWCSSVADRYDAQPWPLAELADRVADLELDIPLTGRADIAPEPHSARTSDRRSSRSSIAILTSRAANHVENTVRILRELSPELDVKFLLAPRERAETFEAYHALVAKRPDRYSFHAMTDYAADCGEGLGEEMSAELETAVRRCSADQRAQGMQIDGVHVWPLLEPMIWAVMRARLVNVSYFATGFAEFLRVECPDLVLVSPDRRPEGRIACELARRSGIPSIHPQTALFADSPRLRASASSDEEGGRAALVADSPRLRPPAADYVTVSDEFAQSVLRRMFGTPAERLLITGIPRFDGVEADRAAMTAVGVGGSQPGADRRQVVLVQQRSSPEHTERMIAIVANTVLVMDNVDLVMRAHPSETSGLRERYAQFLTSFGAGERFSVHTGDLHKLIAESDLIIGAFSNVLLESAMAQRPVLSINLTGEPLPMPFVEQGVAVGAETEDEVADRIRRLLFDDEFMAAARQRQQMFLDNNPHLRDGRAAVRVARVAEVLAGVTQTPGTLEEMIAAC